MRWQQGWQASYSIQGNGVGNGDAWAMAMATRLEGDKQGKGKDSKGNGEDDEGGGQ